MAMRTTDWKEFSEGGRRYRIRARYGIDYDFAERNNQDPYFSITGEIERKAGNGRWMEDSGGMLHDEIARRFPDLVEALPFHLFAWPSGPMHYVANGIYWWESSEPGAERNFRSTVLFGMLPDDERTYEEATDRGGIKVWLEGRLPGLRRAFREEMQRIGVEVHDTGSHLPGLSAHRTNVCVIDKHGETHCGRPEVKALGGLGASEVGVRTNKHGTKIEVIDLGDVRGERPAGMMYANEQEKFWKHSWVVGFTPTNYGILVNADTEQDALDAAVDYAEEQEYVGYFIDEKEVAELEAEGREYDRAGNHGLAIDPDSIWIARRTHIPSASVVLSDDAPGGIGGIA